MPRPWKYKNADELQEAIDNYFNVVPLTQWTITGLMLGIGLSKRTFYKYLSDVDFGETLEEARLKVEHSYEMSLRIAKNPTGPIFALKQFNWRDRQDIDIDAVITQTVNEEDRTMLENIANRLEQLDEIKRIEEKVEDGA